MRRFVVGLLLAIACIMAWYVRMVVCADSEFRLSSIGAGQFTERAAMLKDVPADFLPSMRADLFPAAKLLCPGRLSGENWEAITCCAALRDREASRLMREFVETRPSPPGVGEWIYIWAVFHIEEMDAVPFLIDRLREGGVRGRFANACLQRLSFLERSYTNSEADAIASEWTEWHSRNLRKTWDEVFAEHLGQRGLVVVLDDESAACETLLGVSVRYPLETSFGYSVALDVVPATRSVAMRCSELLYRHTRDDTFVAGFPLGIEDISANRSWEQLKRARAAAKAKLPTRGRGDLSRRNGDHDEPDRRLRRPAQPQEVGADSGRNVLKPLVAARPR